MHLLEKKGYTVIPFHAQGSATGQWRSSSSQGLFQRVLDLVPAGVIEELLAAPHYRPPSAGGSRPNRNPQVYTPCWFDLLSCGPLSRREAGDPLWTTLRLSERKIFIPDDSGSGPEREETKVCRVAEVVAES